MLGLPQSTEVKRQLPKAQLYKQFDWKPSQRESFDGDVSHIDFVNWVSPRTLPAIAVGNEVKEIYVIEVTLKKRDFDTKNIALLAKSIPQRVIYLLHFEDEVMLAVYNDKLFTSQWQAEEVAVLNISGLNLDAVWETIVTSIGQFSVADDSSLTEQIRVDDERSKLLRQIETLERKMRSTAQPRRKREIFEQINKYKRCIDILKKK